MIPAAWEEAWKWYYDGIWKNHFMPNADYQNSDLFGKGNVVRVGQRGDVVDAHLVHLLLRPAKTNWDIAVVPTINGKTTAKLHGDTFAIMNDSKNKDVAFKVLSEMVVDQELPVIYGGMPAKEADRPAFFAALDEGCARTRSTGPWPRRWSSTRTCPTMRPGCPTWSRPTASSARSAPLMDQTPLLDMDAAIAKLKSDLDAAYKAAP